jgi:REP element-mobilizing transposase RayT
VRYEGAIYHVTNRGIDRRDLFWDEVDYEAFLDGLEVGVERFHARVYAYTLMTNHFHLLVETPLGNIDRFMQGVQTRYAGFFNRRHQRHGYVYQGPYRAKLVAGDDYLLRLTRYIHLNPVRTKAYDRKPLGDAVGALRAYRWSSHREYAGLAKKRAWMTYDPIEGHLAGMSGGLRGGYRRYVEAGLVETDREMDELVAATAPWIGEEPELNDLKDRLERRDGGTPGGYRSAGRYLDVETIQSVVMEALGAASEIDHRTAGSWMRGAMVEMVCRYGGSTLAEAANVIGCGTAAAACIRRRELARRRASDRSVRRMLATIEKRLEERMADI